MKLVKLHEVLPTITQEPQFEEHEVMVNFEKVSYFNPTLDGKHTIIMFDSDNRLIVKEPYANVIELYRMGWDK